MIPGTIRSLLERKGLRQLIKFCIVGASSTVISVGLLNLLHYRFGWPVLWAESVPFVISVFNGFYWNRRWTFEAREGDPRKQYTKFFLTNTVGYVLNLSIMVGVLIAAGSLGYLHVKRTPLEVVQLIVDKKGHEFNPLALNGAKAVAIVLVTAWNFTASRLWTFRPTPSTAVES